MNVYADTRKTQELLGDLSVIFNPVNNKVEIFIDDPAEPDAVALINIKLSETQALSFGLALTEIALGHV
jgi:hypothetical protein